MEITAKEMVLWAALGINLLIGVLLVFWITRISRLLKGTIGEVREELRGNREESRKAGKELREEIVNSFKASNDTAFNLLESMNKRLREIAESNHKMLENIRNTFDFRVKEFQESNEKRLTEIRQEVSRGLKESGDFLSKTLEKFGKTQQTQLEGMSGQIKEFTHLNQETLERIRNTLDLRVKELQESNEKRISEMRREVYEGLKNSSDILSKTLEELSKNQHIQLEHMGKQLKELAQSNQESLNRIRNTVDARVKELQESNEKKLEEMRRTVDEKLHSTLEKRLGESFKLVSDRLEAVHKGLGEMQTLAAGVGDLKRVLSNVKARGTWAEIQLGAILEQILTPDQYGKNVCVKPNSSERVEYAVRLPGRKNDPNNCVWLPIDSKFPQENYLRLQDAIDKADSEAVAKARAALVRTVKALAKDIHDKYISPPHTTDFAIMFLGTEGLYAEVLRQPGIINELQEQYRVVVAGPTTLAAILNSLRMGFQTLAIERRASEVWKVLGAVKTEFSKFGEVLDKVKRQLETASRTIEKTGVRTRAMERKLREVEQLPEDEAEKVLALASTSSMGEM